MSGGRGEFLISEKFNESPENLFLLLFAVSAPWSRQPSLLILDKNFPH